MRKRITADLLLEKLREINWYKDIQVIIDELIKQNKNFYFVGGTLRDAIISIIYNIKFFPEDIDIVVETENYNELTEMVENLFKIDISKNSVKITKHPHFLTLSIIFITNHRRIDLSLPRKEKYEYWGALPQVRLGKIDDDLLRRDFSINSIALRYNKSYLDGFTILDPFKGVQDIINKKIRILHKESFLEDPTRILRAVRFSAKLNFDLEKNTANLINMAVEKKVFNNVSRVRLLNEFINILRKGENFAKVVKLLKKFNLIEVYSFIKDIIMCFITHYKEIELRDLKISQEYKFYIRLFYLLEKACGNISPASNEKFRKYLIDLGVPRLIRGEIYKALDIFSGKRSFKEKNSWIEIYSDVYKKSLKTSSLEP